jgi:hypothetical protein
VTDREWAEKQLDKRGPGERLRHAVPCKDAEGHKGWLVVSDQRLWYFQNGPAGGSEEYEFGAETRRQSVPFSRGRRVLLVVDGQPFAMPTELADEFEDAVRRARTGE